MARKNSLYLFALVLVSRISLAQAYSAERAVQDGVEVVRLLDHGRDARVVVVPSLGNRAVEFSIHGKNVLYFPEHSLEAEKQKPGLDGIPFLAPWANRLSEAGYWANGQHYQLNAELGNYGTDNNKLPIHGLLSASELWEVADAKADQDSAWVTCRLAFWRYPKLMEQWPFASEYEMTYRLSKGELEVKTSVKNLSSEAMPVSIGFHPYYRLPGIPRDEWTLTMPAAKGLVMDDRLIPTGDLKDADLPQPFTMRGHVLDNGFTDLARDPDGRAHFRVQSGKESLEVTFGPKYPVAVLWEPPARQGWDPQFVCIEPMAGVTDALNLNHRGRYPQLQTVAPGATWTESFWIRPGD